MKRFTLLALACILSLSLAGCSALSCSHCGARITRDNSMYDPIAKAYVCDDCYYEYAGDIVDQLLYVDFFYDNADDILDYCMDQGMIEDYLSAHGYKMIKK